MSPAQASELRSQFATFAEEWESPEMDVYDDYSAVKTRMTRAGHPRRVTVLAVSPHAPLYKRAFLP